MSAENHDPVLSALANLPAADVEARVVRRIEIRAQSILEAERRYLDRPKLRQAARLYTRAIEPALVATACALYLYSAFSTVIALLH